ncbi:MAG: calcium-binding protein, partial [Kiritimatiellota bacterium]|nr:calcium-binding protein [Kiritimatiellota bacterium]
MQGLAFEWKYNLKAMGTAALVLLMLMFPSGRPVFAICAPAPTSGANTITCDGADDTIDALGGNDRVDGGAGNDTVYGGNGNDTLTGGAGDDTLIGGAGNDSYLFDTDSALGTDTIIEDSGGGTDTLNFTGSSNALTVDLGVTGNQVVNSNLTINLLAAQVENLTGGGGNDVLTGNDLNNTINGGNGNDIITGAGGNDTLNGGAGNDVFVYDTDSPLGRDVVNGGTGTDTLDFSASLSSITVNLATTASDQTVNGNLILRLSNVENVFGGDGDDILTGNGSANVLLGGNGNDILVGGAGNDTLNGGDGYDRVVQTANANQTLTDTLLTGTGNDTLVSIEDAWLTGGAGNNRFTVSGWTGGTATIDGAGGTDTIVSSNDSDFVLTDALLTRSTGSVFTLSNIENASLTGGNGDNLLDASAFTAGNVTLSGGNGNDTLLGGSGNDTLTGGSGNDTYIFSGSALGTDTINEAANADSDTLDFSGFTPDGTPGITLNLASTASQTVNPGDLILRLQTSTSIENVIGSAGADTITGNSRNNIFTGGGGDDILSGGTGNDTYNFDVDEALGTDTIIEAAGGGTDTLDFTGSDASVTVDLAITINQSINVNLNLVLASTQIENVTGGSGNDAIIGNSLNNLLSGGDGDDTLIGLGGNDTLNGGNGNDFLDGGSGNDSLNGGDGDDTYYFDTDSALGTDTLTDIAGGGTDTLDFSVSTGSLNVDLNQSLSQVINANLTLVLGASEIETVLGGSGNDTITGNSRDNTLFGGNGNDTLHGGDGNDTLNGGNGDDTLYGGDGDDTLYGGLGTNSIFGGDGNDTFTTGDGIDAFDGGAGDDLMYITGTHSSGDIVDGGLGSNIFVFQPGTNGPIELVSSGTDTLDFR